MIRSKKNIAILLNIFCIFTGILCYMIGLYDDFTYKLWAWFVLIILVTTVLLRPSEIIRPLSLFILSFLVFQWMRVLLGIMYTRPVISVGLGITPFNIQKTAYYLGISMSAMILIALITECRLNKANYNLFKQKYVIYLNKKTTILLILPAVVLFVCFMIDSMNKIQIVKSHNYLSVSENILLSGYYLFKFGKYFLILWILLGKNANRMYYASILILIASSGYLMLGARGYAICYFFLWLLYFQQRHKLNLGLLSVIGIALIILANSVLEYRLGFQISNGLTDTIINTLHSQGASIEPVFGAITFRNELLAVFPKEQLFSQGDFGNYIDMVRGVGFAQGGFSTSFFAEVYFLGIYGGIFLVLMGICVGILEHGYLTIVNKKEGINYYNILLFMTIPNLIYFARSNIKDYIFKSISTYIIILTLIYLSQSTQKNTYLIRAFLTKKRSLN